MPDSVKSGLSHALRRLLRPLVLLLIRQGISFSEFAELVKHVYVETAARDFGNEEDPISQSRVAALTGLAQTEVRRLYLETLDSEPVLRPQKSHIALILQAWHTEATFIGPYGVPLELTWHSDLPNGPDFCSLVREFGGELDPRDVLKELINAGAVIELEPKYYRVVRREYETKALDPASLERFGRVVENFLNTIVGNLYSTNAEERRVERAVYCNDPAQKDEIELFNAWIKREGQRFLERIDDWFLATFSRPPDPLPPDSATTGLGIYHYVTETKEELPFSEFLVETRIC